MVIMALLVWLRRHSIRKGHVLALVALTVIDLIGFCGLCCRVGRRMPEALVMPQLHAKSLLTVGAAAGFTIVFRVLWSGRFEKPGS